MIEYFNQWYDKMILKIIKHQFNNLQELQQLKNVILEFTYLLGFTGSIGEVHVVILGMF